MPCGLRTNLGLGLWKGWVLQLKGEQLKWFRSHPSMSKSPTAEEATFDAVQMVCDCKYCTGTGEIEWRLVPDSQSDPESGEYRCPSYLFLFGVARSIYSRTCSVKVELVN
jgi:hypothetical protein